MNGHAGISYCGWVAVAKQRLTYFGWETSFVRRCFTPVRFDVATCWANALASGHHFGAAKPTQEDERGYADNQCDGHEVNQQIDGDVAQALQE